MYQKPRGTNDLYYKEIDEFMYVCKRLEYLANIYNFNQIITPTFESLDLFIKNIGETTDIVHKEIYSFQDKSERWLALRPEGTAGVVRAYVENKLFGNQTETCKFWYIDNLFRYERPQKGRNREFFQFGVEYLGTENKLDIVEAIVFANSILKLFGLKEYILKINYLGSYQDRIKWINELKKYFNNYKDQLTLDSINRLESNPLRILDDKEDSKKDFVIKAPKLFDFLDKKVLSEFDFIQNALVQLGIKFVVDTSLVRGLDYYNDCVFEFVSTSDELAKATIIGGGCYNDLIKETGGPDLKGLGFAVGIERLIIALKHEKLIDIPNKAIEYLIVSLTDEKDLTGFALSTKFKNSSITSSYIYTKKKPKAIKLAKTLNAKKIIWLDEISIKENTVQIEDISLNKKEIININELFNKSNKKD